MGELCEKQERPGLKHPVKVGSGGSSGSYASLCHRHKAELPVHQASFQVSEGTYVF